MEWEFLRPVPIWSRILNNLKCNSKVTFLSRFRMPLFILNLRSNRCDLTSYAPCEGQAGSFEVTGCLAPAHLQAEKLQLARQEPLVEGMTSRGQTPC